MAIEPIGSLQLGLKRAFDAVPFGGTALNDGILYLSGIKVSGGDPRRVLLVLSDVQDNSSQHNQNDSVREAQRTGTIVFGVIDETDEWNESKRRPKLGMRAAREFSEKTGGEVLAFKSEKELAAALGQIRSHLRKGYLVRFRVPPGSNTGKPVRLKIEVLRKGVEVFAPQVRTRSTN